MIKFVNRINTDLIRDLKNPKFAFNFYALLFCILFGLYFLFGELPLIKVVKAKQLLLIDLTNRLEVTQTNINFLETAKEDLANNTAQINLLDKYMPVETGVQEYMVDFIDLASRSGYSVVKFGQVARPSVDDAVELNITLESNTYPTTLLADIEKLQRVTQISRMYMLQRKSGEFNIYLNILIYNYIP